MQVLEVYGSGYSDDIDQNGFRKRDKESHRTSALIAIQDIIKMYDIALVQLRNDKLQITNRRYSKLGSNTLKEQFNLLF